MSSDTTASQKCRQVPSSPVRRSQRIRLLYDKSSDSEVPTEQLPKIIEEDSACKDCDNTSNLKDGTDLPMSEVCEEAEVFKSNTDTSANKLSPISEEREDSEQKENSPNQEKIDDTNVSEDLKTDDKTKETDCIEETITPPKSQEKEDSPNQEKMDDSNVSEDIEADDKSKQTDCVEETITPPKSQENLENSVCEEETTAPPKSQEKEDSPNQEKIDDSNVSEDIEADDKTKQTDCVEETITPQKSQENLENSVCEEETTASPKFQEDLENSTTFVSSEKSRSETAIFDVKLPDSETQNDCKDASESLDEINTVEGVTEPVETNQTREKEPKKIIVNPCIDSKIDELLLNASDSESDDENNSFFNSMAEEGEEDTPSEGSNDIVEVGEEINTTESDLSTDESYDRDSFINDDDHCELLSGDEYDLSFDDNSRKRKRILELTCDSDEDVIEMKKPEKKSVKRRKKCRIIRCEDSSDSDTVNKENISSLEDKKILSEDSSFEKQENNITEVNSSMEDVNESSPVTDHNDKKEDTSFENTTDSQNVSVNSQELPNNSTSSFENVNKKVVIIENVKVQDLCNQNISEHITSVINTIFTGVKSSSEVSINLSLDCSSESIDKQNSTPEQNKVVKISHNQETQTENLYKKTGTKKRRKKKKKKKNKLDNISQPLQENNQKEKNSVTKLDNASQPFQKINKKDSNVEVQNKERVLEKNKHLHGIKKSINKRRKKKKLKLSKNTAESILNLTVLEEAVQSKIEKPFFLQTDKLLNNKWGVEKVSVKPSKTNVALDESLKSNNINVHKNKFHEKDFRNLMLYDDNRVKRMKTNLLIQKKH